MANARVIEGDVDIRTESVSWPGDVVVRGDVRSGFGVKARGSVTVHGIVEASTIVSGGEVVVHQGVVGRGKARIEATGAIRVGHVRDATLVAGSDVEIGSSSMNSTIISGGNVTVRGEGVLVGGAVVAKGSLRAKQVGHKGAEVWVKEEGRAKRVVEETIIMLGLDPQARDKLRQSERCFTLAQTMSQSAARNVLYLAQTKVPNLDAAIVDEISFIAKAPFTVSLLAAKGTEAATEENERLRAIVAEIAKDLPSPSQKTGQVPKLREFCLQLFNLYSSNDFVLQYYSAYQQLLTLASIDPDATLTAAEAVYPGVQITIGFERFDVDRKIDGGVFRVSEGRIAVEPVSTNEG